jgi:carbonic anhydrase/acetyltransferase-like protein (isoleucine patch superfamily)
MANNSITNKRKSIPLVGGTIIIIVATITMFASTVGWILVVIPEVQAQIRSNSDDSVSSINATVNDVSNNNASQWANIHSNLETDFNPTTKLPDIEDSAFIHPFAVVIGDCHIGRWVLVAPTAICRGDEGTPIHVGDYSNIQDGVVLHALATTENGTNIDGRRFSAHGERLNGTDPIFAEGYAIYVGDNVSLAHGALVHGPAWIGNNTFVGMETTLFDAKVGDNVAIGVASTITGEVVIQDNKFVPPGSVITTQEQADALPSRIGSTYENINDAVLHVNEQLAEGYEKMNLEKVIRLREAEMEKGMLETSRSIP